MTTSKDFIVMAFLLATYFYTVINLPDFIYANRLLLYMILIGGFGGIALFMSRNR